MGRPVNFRVPPAIAFAFTVGMASLIYSVTPISNGDHRPMNSGQKSCALLADTHTQYIEGVRGLLETAFDTIFTVADADSLMNGTVRLQPAIIVVDLSFAAGSFAGLIRQLRRSSPASKVIALTVHNEPAAADAMLSAGAHAVVLKHFIARDLLAAVDAALEGDRFVTPEVGPVQLQIPPYSVEKGGR
jgi:DNA-binding NarL/FixJ family response regulator